MSREKGLGHACGVRVHRVQKVQRVQRGRFLGLTGPMGRKVLKFDGAFGPEGCGGGSAAGCVEGLYIALLRGRRPFGPRVMVAPFGRRL